MRANHLVLFAIAGKGDRDLFGAVLRFTPGAVLGPSLLVVAAFFDGTAELALWIAALAIDYLGALVGRGRGWRVSPEHFVERHGLIIISRWASRSSPSGSARRGCRSMPA